MALTDCKECKKEVSTKANACPHCGAKLGLSSNQKGNIAAVVGIVALVLVLRLGGDDESPETSPAPEQPQAEETTSPPEEWLALDRSEAMQAQRLEMIERLQEEGIVSKIETLTDYPRIYAGPAWASLPVDDKETFANSVLTYYYAENPESKVAVIRDGRTGEDIGRFSYRFGLELH